jgi:hypothetical protein
LGWKSKNGNPNKRAMQMESSMRTSCISGYEWPDDLLYCTELLDSIEGKIDLAALLNIVDAYDKSKEIIITLLSKEYLEIGKLWISLLNNIDVEQYIVIAADTETGLFLDAANVPNCRVLIDHIVQADTGFKSSTGFTAKGLAITAIKYPLVKLLLELGYHVLLMDIDALLLRKPSKKHFEGADIAFQRIIYFPRFIVRVWGFAACSGFVWFRSNQQTIQLIQNAIQIQKEVYSDQIALNVALWESNVLWEQKDDIMIDPENQLSAFQSNDKKTIDGFGSSPAIRIRALPSKLFWRNDVVPFDPSLVILFHPNSLKDEQDKLRIFKLHNIC